MKQPWVAMVVWAGFVLGCPCLVQAQAPAPDINEETEAAIKAAVARVAPCIVRIETAGGNDKVVWVDPATGKQIRKVVGPTTGVIVSADGYVVSSAFNFVNKPTDITVSIPGGKRATAKEVATDLTRMITLLKLADVDGLPVPQAVPRKDIQVGQWSISLGRTIDPNVNHPPSISIGIISAVNRIWGKAIQTDAKVSPVNYGGPIISIDGRIQGILVPASPQGQDETAGVEWYDSGIGFAIPFEDILAVLPKLKEGKDLKPGILGVVPQSADMYGAEPIIGTVTPDSPAAKADIRPGDKILAINGQPVVNMAQVLHILRPMYENTVISVKILRGKEEIEKANIVLTGQTTAYAFPFLGILPMRDDPEPGVEIRYVYPKSPADQAGLKVGDRILGIAPVTARPAPKPMPKLPMANPTFFQQFSGRDQLLALMARLQAGIEIQLQVKRKAGGAVDVVKLRLAPMPDDVPDRLPANSTAKKALEKPKPIGPKPKDREEAKPEPKKEDPKAPMQEVETGVLKKTNPALRREYSLFVPENYDPNISYGVIIWLHPAGRGGRDFNDMVDLWADFCEDHHFILLGPKAQSNDGWAASETELVLQDLKEVMDTYTVDQQRIIVHGMGIGGQLAFYMGFNARETIRGVATVGAILANNPKETIPTQRVSFFVVAGQKDPIAKDIAESQKQLSEKKHPVILEVSPNMGKEYLNADVELLRKLARWMDSLDRI